ncbi:hypothetical protein PHISCL_04834 [Aspergillus sclerotialis]|uniref:Uncharacterized protein n=1 Tax=Aspergillus sclerotialis TaxID=2070753 RepID=A0A3A2ZXT4_9EURO|nr:hypothetical protein PHISCL_04834 [Aspergillus sclerotialis]
MNLMPDEASKKLEDMGESVERIRNRASSVRNDMVQNIEEGFQSISKEGKKEWANATSSNKDSLPNPDETGRIDRMDKAKMTEYLQEKNKNEGRLPSTAKGGAE